MPSGYSVNACPPTTKSSGLSMSRSSATASPSTRARSANKARACSLSCRAARNTAAIVDAGPSAGMMRELRAAISTASSLTVDSSWPVPPSSSEWAGRAAMVPGPLAGECTRPPIERA